MIHDSIVSTIGNTPIVRLNRAVAVGEVFTVMLPRLRGEAVAVRCAAVSCHRCGGGSAYLVGAVYEAVLSDEYSVEEKRA